MTRLGRPTLGAMTKGRAAAKRAAAREARAPRSLQERFEATPIGRGLISVVVVVTVAALLAWNLPVGSALRNAALPASEPYVNATGLTQTWNLFAPNPMTRTRELEARVHFTDGSTSTWRPPVGGPWLAQYRTYRWYAETARLRLDSYRPLWKPFAEWVAALDYGGRRPDRVDLVRRWKDVAPPGGGADGAWQEEVFYTLDLAKSTGP